MQGVVRTCLLLGGIAACHTSDPGTADASQTMGDGSSSTDQGLQVTWSSATPIPGNATSDVSVSKLLFRVANLRVIGDAGPGDNRTSADSFEVQWSQGMTPAAETFADAPTGLYSHLVFLADGNLVDYSYEIEGTAKVDGNLTPFKIHDRSPLPVSLDTSTMLEPNHASSLAIVVRVDQALTSLDFSKLNNQNGTLTLDTFDSGMNDFRSKMASSVFSTEHPDGRVETH
ncbi:MAG: hypothetical protein ABJE66_20490 [Deltaproteobacteria bacterium]